MLQPVTGTDDMFTRSESKRAYLTLLNNIVSSKLASIFLSDRKSRPFFLFSAVLITSDNV
jgi:exportin-T